MTVHCYPLDQVSIEPLRGKRIAVIGYGNQGRAHALNLRESGLAVVVGQRSPGSGFDRAGADGFEPTAPTAAAEQSDLVILTLPDEAAPEVFEREIRPALRPRITLGFVHGFNIHYRRIAAPPDVNVVMVAPKGPGSLLRERFVAGSGLPCQAAVHQDATGDAEAVALAWAAGIGCHRSCVMRTTFAMETEMDLFGEQAVLCGGVTALIEAAFDTLVSAGYPPEFAYFDCMHELKQIVDLLHAGGIEGMVQRISGTARYGALTRGPRIIGQPSREAMREILREIQSGEFAEEWRQEHAAGLPHFHSRSQEKLDSLLEQIGRRMRG